MKPPPNSWSILGRDMDLLKIYGCWRENTSCRLLLAQFLVARWSKWPSIIRASKQSTGCAGQSKSQSPWGGQGHLIEQWRLGFLGKENHTREAHVQGHRSNWRQVHKSNWLVCEVWGQCNFVGVLGRHFQRNGGVVGPCPGCETLGMESQQLHRGEKEVNRINSWGGEADGRECPGAVE